MKLETERLTLRKFVLEDAHFLLELLNTPGFLRFIGDRAVRTVEQATAYLAEKFFTSYEKYGFGAYLVLTKEQNIPVGITTLVKRDGLEDVDIGYAFLPAFMGKGYAFEAVSATFRYAKNELGIKKIVAITDEDNFSSIKLLSKIGLVFDKKILLPGEQKELLFYTSRD